MNEDAVWRLGEPPVFLPTSVPTAFIEPIFSHAFPAQHAVAFMLEHSAGMSILCCHVLTK